MSDWPDIDASAPVDGPLPQLRARRRRPWLAPVLLGLGAAVAVAVVLAGQRDSNQRTAEVEALTADAHRFVKLVRGGLPAELSIEQVVEYAALRPDVRSLSDLRHKRGQARVDLERKARKLLGEGAPELSGWTAWIATPTGMSRAEVLALATSLRRLELQLTELRAEVELLPSPLELDGTLLPELPTRIQIPPLPADVEYLGSQVWPLTVAVVVFQWGPDKRRRCQRGPRDPRCNALQVSWVNWDGELIGSALADPPPAESYHWDWSVGPDASFYTLVVGKGGRATLRHYVPGATEPRVATVAVGEYARLMPAEQGLTVQTADGIYAVNADLSLRQLPEAYYALPFTHVGLKRRTGQEQAYGLLDGRSIQVVRDGQVVVARTKGAEDEYFTRFFRLADFTSADEAFLRQFAHGPADRLALIFEGSMSRLSLLISPDGGHNWVGAPDQ